MRLEAVGANAVIGYGREGPAFPVDDMKPTRMTLNPGDKGIRLDGRLGGTVYFGALMPGSTGLQVLIDRQVGYTTTLGLRFQDPATLSLPADGSVQVDRPGVRARDKEGVPYVSREVKVGGRMVIAMVKGDGPAVRLPEPGQNKPEKTPDPDLGEAGPKGFPEKEPAAEPVQPIAETRHFEGHTATVLSVAFSPKGRRALSGSADRTIRLWDVKTGKSLRVFEGVTAAVKSVVFAPSGKQALSGGEDGSVVLWDVETGKAVQRFEGHTGAVLCVAFAPNGAHVVSAGADHTLRLWDLARGEELRRFEGHKGPVQAVAFSPNGLWLVSRSQDGTVRRWETRTAKEFKSYPGHDASSAQVCAFDGRRVLSSVADKDLRLWDAESGKELRRFHGHTGRIGAVALSLGDRRALSGGADLLLRLWDLETGKELQKFTGHTKEVTSVAIANDGRHALSGGADNVVRFWDLPRATVAGTRRPEGKEIDFYYWNPRHKVNGISKNLQVLERQGGGLDVTLLPKGVLIAVRLPDGREIGLPDALGSTNIRVKVNPRLGYTTLAGLRFKSNVTVNIGQDGAVYVNRVGIRAIDDMTDDIYISRQVTHGGRRAIVMVLLKRAM